MRITLCFAAVLLLVLGTALLGAAMPVSSLESCTFTADFASSGEGSSSVSYSGTFTREPDLDPDTYVIVSMTGTRKAGSSPAQTILGVDTEAHVPKFAGTSSNGVFIDVALTLSGGDSTLIDCSGGSCIDFHGSSMLSNGVIVTSCSAQIIGDPAFVGFLGQHFQVHGTPSVVHNVISAPALLVNALFVFLDRGECPVYNGKVVRGNCFSHPGTYFGELGFRTRADDRLHVIAGKAAAGFDSLTLNGQSVAVGETSDATSSAKTLSVTRTSTHTATVRTDLFEFDLENSDMYINLLNVRILNLRKVRVQDVHGLLGQTWRSRRGSTQLKDVDGTVDDYVELDNDLFGANVLYNRFRTEAGSARALLSSDDSDGDKVPKESDDGEDKVPK